MAELILNAEVRNKTGKENAKKLRVKDLIPTVVYGKDFACYYCAIPLRLQIEKAAQDQSQFSDRPSVLERWQTHCYRKRPTETPDYPQLRSC